MRITVGESATSRATSPIFRYSLEFAAAIPCASAEGAVAKSPAEALLAVFFSLDSFVLQPLTLPDYSKVYQRRNLAQIFWPRTSRRQPHVFPRHSSDQIFPLRFSAPGALSPARIRPKHRRSRDWQSFRFNRRSGQRSHY